MSLRRWFKEEWKDVRTGKACGRKSAKGGSKRPYPYCRPSKRVNSKTPKTTGEMSKSEKRRKVSEKIRKGNPGGKPTRVSPVKRRKKRTTTKRRKR
jgi:hypothetical protein